MASVHLRRGPSRAALPRRTTRGPLDNEDPLAAASSPPLIAQIPDTSTSSPLRTQTEVVGAPLVTNPDSTVLGAPQKGIETTSKDFSFLLDKSIYHPVSQIDIPVPFRKPLPSPRTEISFNQLSADLDILLSECNFIGAAHLAAAILTSGTIASTDYETIFRLLAIRYSSLELSGNVLLAAQEAKALEDLTSTFYYHDETLPQHAALTQEYERPLPTHIMPFDLRLQALRLQSIGFSDPRRGVTGLYDLGLECRQYLSLQSLTPEERKIWSERLGEVGIRVVNALIEMGDLDCAFRTLNTMQPKDLIQQVPWATRMALLCLKMGNVEKARTLLTNSNTGETSSVILMSLCAIADGLYDDAAEILAAQIDFIHEVDLTVTAKQNLAVAYLYSGQVSKCRTILQDLVRQGYSFQALTINLATVFELSSDKAHDLKVSMASQIAEEQTEQASRRVYTNADFKL